MDWDEHVAPRWPVDLEATVAKNVRWLREGRGISQQQLGSDLYLHGFGVHQMTVPKLDAGEEPLRLNEVAAIGAYFGVPVESLWQEGGQVLTEHEIAVLLEQIAGCDVSDAKAVEAAQRASAVERQASTDLGEAQGTVERTAKIRRRGGLHLGTLGGDRPQAVVALTLPKPTILCRGPAYGGQGYQDGDPLSKDPGRASGRRPSSRCRADGR